MRKWIVFGGIALLVLAVLGIALYGLFTIRAPRQFRIAAGPKEGTYYASAQALSEALATKGYRLQVLETEGSLENVALLKSGQADIGLLQGGTATFTDTAVLQTLALIAYEPVVILPVPLVGERDAFPSISDVEIPANPYAQEYFRQGPTPLERVLPFEVASPLLPRYTLPEVEEKLAFMRGLDEQLAQKARLTAGYMQSYYQMRGDVRYVIAKLEQRRAQLLAEETGARPLTI